MYSSKQSVKYFSQGVFFLALTMLAPGILAEEGYSYSEDWALVSAPPPPGPYRPVHLDPRVPGQGAVSSIMMDIPMSESGRPGSPAQAAGQATPPAGMMHGPGRQSAGGPAMPYRMPAPYGMRPGYPQPPARYPQAAPHHGGGMQPPPPGYYGADRPHPDEVPPPDVYDAMQGGR